MNTKNNALVGIVILVVGFGLGYLLAGGQRNSLSMEHTMTMDSMMESMMSGLDGKTGDTFDKSFIKEMIVHHQGAIAMAQRAKTNAKHSEIKTLADTIISAQTGEIVKMEGWLKAWYFE